MTTPNIRQPIMTFAADTVALNIICEGLYGLIDNDERASFFRKNHTQFKTSVQNHTLFKDQNGRRIITLWGRTYLYSPYKEIPPIPLQPMKKICVPRARFIWFLLSNNYFLIFPKLFRNGFFLTVMINWYIKGKTLCRPILLLIIIAIRESQSPVARSSDFANPPYNELKSSKRNYHYKLEDKQHGFLVT